MTREQLLEPGDVQLQDEGAAEERQEAEGERLGEQPLRFRCGEQRGCAGAPHDPLDALAQPETRPVHQRTHQLEEAGRGIAAQLLGERQRLETFGKGTGERLRQLGEPIRRGLEAIPQDLGGCGEETDEGFLVETVRGEPADQAVSGAEGGQLTPPSEPVPVRLRERMVVPRGKKTGPLGERQRAIPALPTRYGQQRLQLA